MFYVNREQFNFLKYICKTKMIIYSDLSNEQVKIADFLEENKLIDVSYQNKPHFDFETKKASYERGGRISATISETGKAYLSERKRYVREKWIPYTITTVISVLALMKSYGCGIDELIISCMQLLKRLLQ